ncbi:MAG: hypothetical protein ACE5HQ_13955 [Gemmatimonadota bacterium]
MKKWLRRIRGTVGTGLTWAVGWTIVGILTVMIADGLGLNTDVVDIWIPVFAYPAFIGGVTFSAVLGIAGRRRRLDELSLPQFAGWGALGGLLVAAFIVTMGTIAGFPGWSLVIGSIVTLLCTGSAAGSLALARRAEERALLDATADLADVGLTEGDVQELLGGR